MMPGTRIGHQGTHVGVHPKTEARVCDWLSDGVVKAYSNPVASPNYFLGGAIRREEFQRAISNLPVAPAILYVLEVSRKSLGSCDTSHVSFDHVPTLTVHANLTTLDPQTTIAQ